MKVCKWMGHKIKEGKNDRNRDVFYCERCEETELYRDSFSNTWYKDFWENSFVQFTMAFLVGLLIMSALVLIPAFIISKGACNDYSTVLPVEVRWNFWTGCMAEHPKFGWVPVDKYFEIINLYIP